MKAQVLLDRAPVLTFGSTRLSFSWISVFLHPPRSGRQRPFLWLTPLTRFSALSAAVHWLSLSSHIKHELFVTPFGGVLVFFPLPITSYWGSNSLLPSFHKALNDHFYAISDKYFLDFHTALLKEASSTSLQSYFLIFLQVFTYNTSCLYHYKM